MTSDLSPWTLVENVILSVGHTDISHAVRLSSVWPINFQYHSQAAAEGYSCVDYVKIGAHFIAAQQFQHSKKEKVR